MPRSLLPDVPMYINGFTPRNFNLAYAGLVPANEALVRSLNIPFVDLLSEYGTERFRTDLENLGFTGFNKSASHYGLSMILGGGEVSLWEVARAYASMGAFVSGDEPVMQIQNPTILSGESALHVVSRAGSIRKGSAFITLRHLTELSRPDEETGWHYFNSSSPVAWKTGTSFGFRDAWAVGVTPGYVVAVWVGNAGGYGVNGLTGTQKAAPVMFRVFNVLNGDNRFFNEPWNDLTYAAVCIKSGLIASPNCEQTRDELVPANVAFNQSCGYHQLVHLSSDGKFRVNAACYPLRQMVHKKWFVVAPRYAAFYRKSDMDYTDLPPFKYGCEQSGSLQFIYPDRPVKIYQPRDFGGDKNPVVLEAAHENSDAAIRWFTGEGYMGTTRNIHQMSVVFNPGVHTVTITDDGGNECSVVITVLDEATKKPPNP
jgi:penicillin-binding protein 1C